MLAAHQTHFSLVVVDVLSGGGKFPEFVELVGEAGKLRVVGQLVDRTAFVKSLLDLGSEVGKVLLGKGSRPGRDGGGGGRIESRGEGHEGLEHVGGRVVGLFPSDRVVASGGKGAEHVKDSLRGGVVTDGGADVVELKEMGETGEVTEAGKMRKGVSIGRVGDGRDGGEAAGEGDDGRATGTEVLIEGNDVVEKVEGAVVVGEFGGSGGGQA